MRNLLQIATIICLLIAILFFLQVFRDNLMYSRTGIANGEFWRLWTGHFVHLNYKHLLLNSIGLCLFAGLYNKTLLPKTLISEVAILTSSISVGLYYLDSHIIFYAGLSALLYGLFTLYSIKASKLQDYLFGYIVFFIISFKIIWVYIDPSITAQSTTFIQAPIANDAHLYGYLTALTLALIKMKFCNESDKGSKHK